MALRRLHPARQKTDPAINFAQLLAAIDIVAIFAAIAIARRPADHFNQLGPLGTEQRFIFGL